MMRGFYYKDKAKKRSPAYSLVALRRKAEQGTITEQEAEILDAMVARAENKRED